jgi:hypothetical protein
VNEASYPVTILVERPDGTKESVRVGTAIREGEGFRLSLGELSIGAAPDRARPSAPSPARAAAPSRGDGLVFPPYGRSKGAPIAGASTSDLEYYIQGSRRSLDDPGKARWHDKERVLLAAMEAELERQKGGGGRSTDRGADRVVDSFDADAPPYSDDDIPF